MGRKDHDNRLALGVRALRLAVLGSDAVTPPEARRAAFDGSSEEPVVARFVALVQRQAYRLTDADVSALTARGLSEDEVFEFAVAAAVGVAQEHLDAGLALLEKSGNGDAPS
jgi:hypothetical protein